MGSLSERLEGLAAEVRLLEANDAQLLAVNLQLARANWALERRIRALEMAAVEEAVPHADDKPTLADGREPASANVPAGPGPAVCD